MSIDWERKDASAASAAPQEGPPVLLTPAFLAGPPPPAKLSAAFKVMTGKGVPPVPGQVVQTRNPGDMDTGDKLLPAVVLAVLRDEVLIHYIGWKSMHNEWLDWNSP